MASLQLTTSNLDDIALGAFGQRFSTLSDAQKYLLAGSTSPSLPSSSPGGVAGMALSMLTQYAESLGYLGTDNLTPPETWAAWFTAEATARAVLSMKPDQYPAYRAARTDAMRAALESLPGGTASQSAATPGTITLTKMRQHVISVAIRQKPPFLPSVTTIDEAFAWAVDYLWNRAFWLFRRRTVTMTIPDGGGAPTFTDGLGASETFAALATRRLYYTDNQTDGVVPYAEWKDGDDFIEAKAYATVTGVNEEGRPSMFRLHPGATTVWQWHPVPDQNYTAKGEVYIAQPAYPTSATDSTTLAAFPAAFRAVFRDIVTAKVLREHNAPGSERLLERALSSVTELIPMYQDIGTAYTSEGRDVHRDAENAGFWGGQLGSSL